MILDYFNNLASGIEASIQSEPAKASARKVFALEIARLGIRLFSGQEKVAWCGVLVPFDLLHALGVNSCFVEFVGAMLASTGAVPDMLERAEQTGFSTDSCSYHRSVMGAALQGIMPQPDFLIATSNPCSGGLATIENLSRHFHRDLFVIHIPHRNGPKEVAYLADQFRSMVDFVSAHTGKKLDPAALREVMENTNRARELMIETYQLAQTVPTPARRKDLINFGIVMSLFLGSQIAVDVARAFRDEFAKKVRDTIPGIKGEQIRLLWLQNRIQFNQPLEKLLETEHGAAVVVDELNDITWEPMNPSDPFSSLAQRTLSIPLTGPASRRIQNLQRLARAYRVDGVINPCHWGCRQGTGSRGLVEQGMKQINLPVLNLEVDCVDPRHFSIGQIKTRLQAFVEMIRSRSVSGPAI